MHADMDRSIIGTLVLAALTLLQSGFCRGATFEECVYPTPAFDSHAPSSDAVVVGDPGSRALMHPVHPGLCKSPNDRFCNGRAYVVPGDHVQTVRRCGAWVYAKYLGESHKTVGWIDVGQLSEAPSDSAASQKPVDVTRAPMCTHDRLWIAHDGRFSASPGELIAVHARNPILCTEPAAGLCGVITLIKPGPTTYYSEQCGDWVYASYRGVGSEGGATGWVDSRNVVPLLPPPQPPKRTPTDWPYEHDPLYRAVMADNLDQIRQIVASGRNLNTLIDAGLPRSSGPYKFLILSTAIEQGKVNAVRLLLSLGADPNGRDPNTSCLLAAAANNLEIAKALIEAGADVNCGGQGWPLKWAAGNVRPIDVAFLKLLIAAHADVNVDTGAPLGEAISRNNVEGAELLMTAGASPRLGGRPPLLQALDSYGFDPAMILVLLTAGADANYREPDYYWESKSGEVFQAETVLTIAAEKGYFEVVRILLDHGADPLKPRQDGLLPAAVAGKAGHRDVAALIEKYAGRHTSDR
jgi:ankyrin repeat protein